MLAISLGIFAALCWSVHDLLAKFQADKTGPYRMAFWVMVAGAASLVPAVLWRGTIWDMPMQGLILALVMGCFYAFAVGGLFKAFSLAPVSIVARRAIKDTEICGHYIPTGTPIHVGIYASHRIEAFWHDPDVFDPERFAPERAEDKAHKYAWAPFGGGAHKCIGMHFDAWRSSPSSTSCSSDTSCTSPPTTSRTWTRRPAPIRPTDCRWTCCRVERNVAGRQ